MLSVRAFPLRELGKRGKGRGKKGEKRHTHTHRTPVPMPSVVALADHKLRPRRP